MYSAATCSGTIGPFINATLSPTARSVLDLLTLRGLEVKKQELQRQHSLPEINSALLELLPLGISQSDAHIFWSPASLHVATLALLERDPALLQNHLATQSSWDWRIQENRLRLAVYLNLPEWTTLPTRAASDWACRYWLPSCDFEFLLSRHPDLQKALLQSLRPGLWAHGEWNPQLDPLVAQLDPGPAREIQIELALARGRYDQAQMLLDAATRRKGYDAVLLFLDGQTSDAHARFAKLIARRKPVHAVLEPLVAVFARLTAVRQNDLDAIADPRLGGFPQLDKFFAALAKSLRAGSRMELPELAGGLEWCAAWALRSCLSSPPLPRLDSLDTLRQSGLLGWLEQLQEDCPRPWGAGVVRKPAWRIWLDALEQKGRLGGSEKSTSAVRLVWQVADLQLRAYKQNVSGFGGLGTEIALKSLLKSPPDFLSEQDHKVLNQVERRQWGTTIDVVHVQQAVRALVGHPHVYFEEEPVRLLEVQQKIRLHKAGGGYRLELTPRFRNDDEFRCRLQRKGLLEICFPSPWNSTLEPILEEGEIIPASAQEELRQALAPWMDKLELDYGHDVRPLAELAREGEVVARLVPYRGGLRLTWILRMLGPQGPTLPLLQGPLREALRWEGRLIQVERNFERESQLLEGYLRLCPALCSEGETLVADLEEALDLLQSLEAAKIPLEWPQGQAWKVRPQLNSGQMSLRAATDGEWFAIQGKVVFDESTILELGRTLELLREYPGRYLRLAEGDYLQVAPELRGRLAGLDELLNEDLRLSPLAVASLEELDLQVAGDPAYAQALQRFTRTEPAPVPTGFQADLRDYQLEGFQWLAQRAQIGVGACLADDMGVGKTVQALALMAHLQSHGPHLVICPTSVTANWRDQIYQFAPSLRPRLYEGKERTLEDLQAGDVIIASYRLLLQEQAAFAELDWNVALLDEAQFIKNSQSKTARACYSLQARTRVATSGTPIENRLSELWSIFRYLNPTLLGSLTSFRRRFETAVVGANTASHRRLKRLVAPFLLRRSKAQVLSELPSRTEITLAVDLSADERALYEKLRRLACERLERPGGALQVLAHLTRLRQACCHPRLLLDQSGLTSSKFEAFFELLADLQAGRHRCLVFSQFTELLDLLEVDLQARKVEYLRLDGSTPNLDRRRRVAAFQDGQADVFLISLKAGGTGLNLTAADYVVHLDPWWNPAAEDQASDRAHRIGQTRPVTIYRLIARNTIEEKVVRMHRHKRQLAQGILDGQPEDGGVSQSQMLELLEPESEDRKMFNLRESGRQLTEEGGG